MPRAPRTVPFVAFRITVSLVRSPLGIGDGTFGPKAEVENDWRTSLAAADQNGDGKIDLGVRNELSGEVAMLLNTIDS